MIQGPGCPGGLYRPGADHGCTGTCYQCGGRYGELALTISADGGIDTPDRVQSKQELGDSYGMRGASALGKEWYEHAEGYCSYLRGKTAAEIRKIPADGSDADLASLCTIEVDAFQNWPWMHSNSPYPDRSRAYPAEKPGEGALK